MKTIDFELLERGFRHETGHCWIVLLPDDVAPGDAIDDPRRSILELFEDGLQLGPPHSEHSLIRSLGMGRYSHWGRDLYFSTSDYLDPTTSGRRYSVRAPRAASSRFSASPEERLVAAFGALAGERHNYPNLSPAEIQAAIGLARSTLEKILSFAPRTEYATEVIRACKKLEFLRGVTFEEVNGFPRQSPRFDQAVQTHRDKFRNGRAIHLELGSYTAWPKARTDEYMEQMELGDMIRLDMNLSYEPDIAASVTALPFADETIDIISSNSLFEHVAYPHDIIREAFRVLRPGGMLLTTVPFHFVFHGCPSDYLRYTGQFFDEVCTRTGFAPVMSDTWATSGVYYTMHQFLKAVTAVGPKQSRTGPAGQMAHLTMMALLAALQGFDDYFDGGGANHFQATRAMAIKPGMYEAPSTIPDRAKPFLDRFKQLICPATGLPLRREGDTLISLDGSRRYDVINGIPNLFVAHGFGSSFPVRASSRERLAEWSRRQ